MATDSPDEAAIAVPPCWEAVFASYVLLVGGPMDDSILAWPSGVEFLTLAGDASGRYVPSEGKHFGVWEAQDGGK
jgi:hypothetical protein